MKKHPYIGNWRHFSGETRQRNGNPQLISTVRITSNHIHHNHLSSAHLVHILTLIFIYSYTPSQSSTFLWGKGIELCFDPYRPFARDSCAINVIYFFLFFQSGITLHSNCG